MTIAGNQSYFFPYIGYFQLINSVDKFTIYDNFNFISKGWVNRNNILLNNGSVFMITLPLVNRSSFTKINELEIDDRNNSLKWRRKICKTIYDNYLKAPMFSEMYGFIESLIFHPTRYLSELNANLIVSICNYLNIRTTIAYNPSAYNRIESLLIDERYMKENYPDLQPKEARIVEICRAEGAGTIHNSIGGAAIYSKEIFARYNIRLNFLKTGDIKYRQFNPGFVPNLSIIDVLMFNSRETVQEMLTNYDLI
ncbi:MAG TPA: WbqC family protein [Bacteroidales bacterium]|nr:WbqC family protein [Bacteroidales bacterium]